MRTLNVFTQVSLNGRFAAADDDLSWAHHLDEEFQTWVRGNAESGGALLFGRITYAMMAAYWPTPLAAQQNPYVAAGMNAAEKYVASRTLNKADWAHTTLLKGDLVEAVRTLKKAPGPGLTILGSGSLVTQLGEAGLVDQYTVVINPLAMGGGRSLFEGLHGRLALQLSAVRPFKNGAVVLTYQPVR